MQDFGLNYVFDNVIGSSAGAPTVSYFVAGQAKLGTSIYYEELVQNDFLAFNRFITSRFTKENIARIDMLCDVFRGKVSNKALDIGAILNSRTRVHISATEYETGKSKIFPFDGKIDLIKLMQASIAMPVLYSTKVDIDGIRYIDGALGSLIPSSEWIDHIDPTDIVILANRSQGLNGNYSLLERHIMKFFIRKLPQPIQYNLLNYNDIVLRDFMRLRSDTKRNYVIVWGDEISAYEMNHDKLKTTANDSYHTMMDILRYFQS